MRYSVLATEVLDHQTGLIWRRAIAENLSLKSLLPRAATLSSSPPGH
jgi:hypothetical protein